MSLQDLNLTTHSGGQPGCAHLNIIGAQAHKIAKLQLELGSLTQENERLETIIEHLKSSADSALHREEDLRSTAASRIFDLANGLEVVVTAMRDISVASMGIDGPVNEARVLKETVRTAKETLDNSLDRVWAELFRWFALQPEPRSLLMAARVRPGWDNEGTSESGDDLPPLKESEDGDRV